MTMLRRATAGLFIASALALPLAPATSAAEIPTGAARIVAKVQLQVLTAKNTLLFNVGAIQANAEEKMAGK